MNSKQNNMNSLNNKFESINVSDSTVLRMGADTNYGTFTTSTPTLKEMRLLSFQAKLPQILINMANGITKPKKPTKRSILWNEYKNICNEFKVQPTLSWNKSTVSNLSAEIDFIKRNINTSSDSSVSSTDVNVFFNAAQESNKVNLTDIDTSYSNPPSRSWTLYVDEEKNEQTHSYVPIEIEPIKPIQKDSIQVDSMLRLRGGGTNLYNRKPPTKDYNHEATIEKPKKVTGVITYDVTANEKLPMQGNEEQIYQFIEFNTRKVMMKFGNNETPTGTWSLQIMHDNGENVWSRIFPLRLGNIRQLRPMIQDNSWNIEKLIRSMHDNRKNSEDRGTTYFTGFRLIMNQFKNSGGTNLFKTNNVHTGKITHNGKIYHWHSPKSYNNNCSFAAFSYVCDKGNKQKEKYDSIRKIIGLDKGTEVTLNQLKLLAEYYQVNCIVHVLAENVVVKHEVENPKHTVELLLLHWGHYVNVTKIKDLPTQCKTCGKKGIKEMSNHKCNDRMITYYNAQVKKQKNIMMNSNIPWATAEEKKIQEDNTWVFDIETYIQHESFGYNQTPYSIAWYKLNSPKESIQVETGIDCVAKFVDFCSQLDKDTIMVGFNNCRFDNLLVAHNALQNNKEITGLTKNRGRLMGMRIGKVKFFDLNLFLAGSLDENCKNFKVPSDIAKGKFDHKKIKTWDDVEKHKNEWLPYLKNDIYATAYLFNKFQNTVYEKFKAINRKEKRYLGQYNGKYDEQIKENKTKFIEIENTMGPLISNYATLPSCAFWLAINDIDPNATMMEKFDPNTKAYMYTKAASYGGRTYGTKKSWSHPQLEDLKNMTPAERKATLEIAKNSLKMYDVKSEYPAAMKGVDLEDIKIDGDYPYGESKWLPAEESFKDGLLGFYHIKFSPPKNIKHVILPRRVSEFNESVFLSLEEFTKYNRSGVVWSLLDGEGIYDNITIKRAIDNGYKVEFIGDALVWLNKKKIFDKFIGDVYAEKQKQDDLKANGSGEYNAALRESMKLLMNAAYGNFQLAPETIETQIITNYKEYCELLQKGELEDFKRIDYKDTSYAIVSVKIDECQNKRPSQIASFVLSYSKQILDGYTSKLVNGDLTKQPIIYCDTDSIVSYESYFSNITSQNQLGGFVDDLDGWIIEFKYLCPKVYCIEYVDYQTGELKYKNRMKGFPQDKPIKINGVKDQKLPTKSKMPYDILTEKIHVDFSNAFKRDWTNVTVVKEEMNRTLGVSEWVRMQWREDLNEYVPWGYDENWKNTTN